MTKRSIGSELNALPTPPQGWTWRVGTDSYDGGKKITFYFTLYDTAENPRGSGRIAVDLYGWEAVTARATTLIREATA